MSSSRNAANQPFRLSRRAFLALSAARASGIAAAGAMPLRAGTTRAAQQSAKRGGTFHTTISGGSEPQTLNPTLASAPNSNYLMFEPLIRYKLVDQATSTYQAQPALAESWQWAPDNLSITFQLRSGVTFHDGSAWNADAAKWNFDLMMTNPKSFAKSFVTGIDHVEVVDPMQIRIVLSAPNAALLANISDASARVYFISPTQYQTLGEEAFGEQPSGTGPMQFDSWVKGSMITGRRFGGYWDKGVDGQPLPYVDASEYRLIPQTATAQAELRAGNLDFLPGLDPQDVAGIKANSDLTFVSPPATGGFSVCLGLNQQQGAFGQNPKLRQAALTAFNRDAILKTFGFGLGTVAPHPYWTEGVIGYDASLPTYNYNEDAAKQLMSDAGLADGVDVTLTVIQRPLEQQQAEVIKQMWDTVGIRTTIEVLERTAWIDKLTSGGSFDAAFWRGIFPADPDQLSQFLSTDGVSNWSSYSDPQVDQLMIQARSVLDVGQRAALYGQVQQLVYQDACLATAYYAPDMSAARSWLQGLDSDVNTLWTTGVWLDK